MTALSLARIVAEELARAGLCIDAEVSGRARKTVFLSALPGFALRQYWSGRRVYIVQRRIGGRMRTITIGNAAVLSEAVARDVASRILLRAQVGENPAAARARVRSAPTYRRFLDEYWGRMASQWKLRTQETHDGYRRLHLDDAFAGKFIDEIDTADVARWFARIGERSGPGAANRAMEILKAMMRKAEDWGYRAEGSNPCSGVRTNRRQRCERFLSEQELARVGAALKRAEASQPIHAAAVSLILLTGCRKSEIIALRWSEVRGQRLLLTDSKTGPRTVWMGSAARAVIDRLPRARGVDEVFGSALSINRSALDGFWRQVREDAALPGVRLHDLRHSFASFAARQLETLPMIGKLLGHAKIASTARYAHLDDQSVLNGAERVGQLIACHFRDRAQKP